MLLYLFFFSLLPKPFDQSLHGPLTVGPFSKGCKAEIAFSAGTESYNRCAYDVRAVQEFVEELPAGGDY